MDSVTREDLKRNELGEAIEGAIHYAEDHSKSIVRALAALGAIALVAIVYILWTSSRREGANDLLVRAMRVFDAEIVATGANPDEAVHPTFATEAARKAKSLELFGELDRRYGGGKVGRVAKLYLAQLALADNDKAKARTLWADYLSAEKSGPMAAAAQVNIWKLDRAEGKAQAVADEIQRQLAAADRALPEDVLLYQLALTQDALGQKGEAAGTWRKIVDEHPTSPYFSLAQKEAGPAAKES
jgi:hypothetical protein